jgi:hypothetical protein
MNFKLKPLSVAMLATVTVLGGCSTEEEEIVKTRPVEAGQVNPTTGWIETAASGLTCKSPDIVQSIDADFHPLTTDEITALRTAALAIANPDSDWDSDEIAAWDATFDPYTFDYGTLDLYSVLGLTAEEEARRVVAKEEARAFKISQKQDVIFGDDFDTWFDAWFDSVPYVDYLGKSQRLQKAARGAELTLSSADNGDQVCYTPPTECPNYQMVDESGTYDCIVPEANPIEGAPTPEYTAGANEAVIYFRKNGDQTEANYTGITIHAWNNSNCTSYNEDTSITNWGSGKASAGIDDNYGMYWVLDLVDGHDNCGNMIVYDKNSGSKFITDNDAMIPLGNSGDTIFHNVDKMSFFQEGFPANLLDGVYLANQHPYFGAAAGSKSCGWGTTLDDAGEACVGQAIDNCPTGTYAVGVGQVDIASKCIAEFATDDTTLYLRGGFNGWGNPTDGQDFEYVGDGEYRKNFVYGAHPDDATLNDDGSVSYFFKVADADWSEPSTYGGIKGGDTPAVGTEISVTAGEGVGQDMSIAFEANSIYQFLFNASDVSDAKLAINKVPLDAFPVLTYGDSTMELAYKADGVYTARIALEAMTYNLSVADTAAEFAVGAAEASEATLSLNSPVAIADNGEAMSIAISDAGEYDFYLDYSDTDNPTFEVKPAIPLGTTKTFIRGGMNEWGDPAEDEIIYDESTSTYSVVYGLEASTTPYQFKFASSDWSTVDLGTDKLTFSADDDAVALTKYDDNTNIGITADESTSYLFAVDFSQEETIVKVSKLPIFLRGGMNGWGETDQFAFNATDADNDNEAGHEYVISASLAAENVFFKVATSDWSTVNLGSATDGPEALSLDTSVTLGGANDNNLSFNPASAGTYKFTFNEKSKTLVISQD